MSASQTSGPYKKEAGRGEHEVWERLTNMLASEATGVILTRTHLGDPAPSPDRRFHKASPT